MRFLILLFSMIVASSARKSIKHIEDLEKFVGTDYQIYEWENSHKHDLCDSLRCHKHEVCIVNDVEAMCISKALVKEHGKRKSGKSKKYQVLEQKKNRSDKEDDLNDTTEAIKRSYLSKTKFEEKKHRHNDRDVEHDCSQKDIVAVGKRLLDWFSIIHKHEPQTAGHIPKHNIPCNPEASWVFSIVDSNQDGELSLSELGFIENDPHEPCLKPFLDRCDQDADDEISPDEWCDCFMYSGKEREEPLCHADARKVDPHLLGAFHPRCNVDGYYKPIQCHEGECWCVDKYGREFDHSRVEHKKPDCGEFANEDDGEDIVEEF